jgi:hypothetical protein
MNRSRLERLTQQFLPPAGSDAFAPLGHSQWVAGFCAAVDGDMNRSPRWCHYKAPYRHHRAELTIWLRQTITDFAAIRGRMPVGEEMKRWVDAARLAAAPWSGMETWPQ